jgi:hypothetical protein
MDLHCTEGLVPPSRTVIALGAFMLISVAASAAGPRDVLSRAKQLYNSSQYEDAISAARDAARTPALASAAHLVAARALLERFRDSNNEDDKREAREAIKQVRAPDLTEDDRVELTIALGESLYFDEQAGAAAEQFELALGRVDRKNPVRRERLLDWWATALDRQSQSAAEPVARILQARIIRRMEDELRADMGATVASYWLAAAARSSGDIERAWDAAIAGWVRVSQLGQRGASARGELDALVTRAIIPDRARAIDPASPEAAAANMRSQWDSLKRAWSS